MCTGCKSYVFLWKVHVYSYHFLTFYLFMTWHNFFVFSRPDSHLHFWLKNRTTIRVLFQNIIFLLPELLSFFKWFYPYIDSSCAVDRVNVGLVIPNKLTSAKWRLSVLFKEHNCMKYNLQSVHHSAQQISPKISYW